MKLENNQTMRIEIRGIKNATLVSVANHQGEIYETYSVEDGGDIGAQINALLAVKIMEAAERARRSVEPVATKPNYPGPVPKGQGMMPATIKELDALFGGTK